MRVIDSLIKALRSSAVFNRDVQLAPACILWPDRDRQWEAVIPRLQAELPELLVLGDYAPDKRAGPAIWLRCVLARKTDDVALPEDCTPIFYLPGVSRQDLRAVESCPEHLKPLAELQYRGVIWSQMNAKDWTVLAFLKSDQGGLGLDVAQDNDAKNAMQLALYRLLDEEIELLKGKRLDRDYFNTLLSGGDPVRDLLQWLDQPDVFQSGRGDNEWRAFVEISKSQMAFNPQNDGALVGAVRLAAHDGPWAAVWERFCEAPKRYPNIPAQIRRCKAPSDTMFWHMSDGSCDGWPQWNEDQESSLRRDLLALNNVPGHEARDKLLEMEKLHGRRRQLVWAELGEAPLAQAMEHLAVLAETTKNGLAAGTAEDLAAGYRNQGWRADDALIRVLSVVEKPRDLDAVTSAIRAIYLPWAEESARHLQKVVDAASYPGGTMTRAKLAPHPDGECILFADGLRFDGAKRLVDLLDRAGYQVEEGAAWTALPSVTGTGRPAVTPVKDKIRGQDANTDFEPCVAGTGHSLEGGYHLKKLLADNGWKVLEHSDAGDGQGNAWCEFGDLDEEGHDRGWKLAKHMDGLLGEIRDRISALLGAGWKSVRVVTDHGWLMLPGGLPKIDLPSALTDNKWGRCAAIKPGASTEERLFPWFWNPNQYFALADGISCFRAGQEYAHGGLSLQECLTLELTVTRGTAGSFATAVKFTDVVWKGLRCTVAVDGQFSGLSLDVRTRPGDPLSSAVSVKPLKEDGTASVIIEDEDLLGEKAMLVLLDTQGKLMGQCDTVIGGGNE